MAEGGGGWVEGQEEGRRKSIIRQSRDCHMTVTCTYITSCTKKVLHPVKGIVTFSGLRSL